VSEAWREIGRVRSVNPRNREVRVAVRKELAHAFDGLGWVHFAQPTEAPLRCKAVAVSSDGEVATVALAPGVSRDLVARLKGVPVVMAPGDIPPRPGREWRLDELKEMVVVAEAAGDELGRVVEVHEGPANDAFTVKRPDGSRFILPAIPQVLRSVDRDAGVITVGDLAAFVVEP